MEEGTGQGKVNAKFMSGSKPIVTVIYAKCQQSEGLGAGERPGMENRETTPNWFTATPYLGKRPTVYSLDLHQLSSSRFRAQERESMRERHCPYCEWEGEFKSAH